MVQLDMAVKLLDMVEEHRVHFDVLNKSRIAGGHSKDLDLVGTHETDDLEQQEGQEPADTHHNHNSAASTAVQDLCTEH